MAPRPALFIDRDRTPYEEGGHVNPPHRLCLLPRSGAAVRRLNEAGIAAVVVAAAELGRDRARSAVVGDKGSDLSVARAVGAHRVLVKTGDGLGESQARRRLSPVEPDHAAADLLDAVEWLIARQTA